MLEIIVQYFKSMFRHKSNLLPIFILPLLLIFIVGQALDGELNQSNFHMHVAIINENEMSLEPLIETLNYHEITYDLIDDTFLEDKFSQYSAVIWNDAPYRIAKSEVHDFEAKVIAEILQNLENNTLSTETQQLSVSVFNSDMVTPTATEYYSVTLIGMVIFTSMSYAANMIYLEIFEYRGLRLRSLPISTFKIFLSMSIMIALTMTICSVAIIFVTKFLFHVRWQNYYLEMTMAIFGFSFIGANFGMLISGLAKSYNHASNLTNIVSQIFLIVSGGYFIWSPKLKGLQLLQKMMPNFEFQELLFALNYTGSTQKIQEALIYLVLMILVSSGGIYIQSKRISI